MLFCHWTQEKTVERRGAENVPCHCGKEKSGTYQCRIYRARARCVLSVHEICILDSRSVLVRILGRRRAPAPDQFYLEENPYQKGNCLTEWLKKLPDYVKSWETSLYRFAERLPDGLQSSAEDAIKSFSDKLLLSSEERAAQRAQGGEQNSNINLLSILKTPLNGVWSTAKQIPSILIGVLLFIIAACFMTAGYDGIVGFIKNQLTPQKRRTLSKTKQIVFSSMGKLVKSYALIMLITFAEMSIGLSVLKVIGAYKSGYIFIIAIITAIVDILPVLGTGTVVIPWAVFSLINGSYGLGIGLIVIYACITVIRQIIEPKIVASNLGIPPIVSIMGMYIGLQLFGFIGIFIMPIVITVLKVLNDDGVIHIWRSSKKSVEADAAAVQPEDVSAEEENQETDSEPRE